MSKIPKELLEEILADPFYRKCCVSGSSSGKIDFHHNLIYGGKQVQAKFCILPLSKEVHDDIVYYKEQCDWIMLNRATDDELRRYSKATNYIRERERLNKRYGTYKPETAFA